MGEVIECVKQLNFFSSLNEEELASITTLSKVSKHPKGSILYYENDSYNRIFFLVSGLLKVYKIDKHENEIFLYHIYKNSLISELTTLDTGAIQCFSNAEFMDDSVILEVDFEQLKEKFLSKNRLNKEFINEILLKTGQLHCVVNRELVFDATAKVAFMLSSDLEMFNKLKRQEVSFMLHIQPETLSRVLKKLKRSELIEIEDAKIKVKDTQALNMIYRGEGI